MENGVLALQILVGINSLIIIVLLIRFKKNSMRDIKETVLGNLNDEMAKTREKMMGENIELRLKITQAISDSNEKSVKELFSFKDNLNNQLFEQFSRLSQSLNNQMEQINKKVEMRLDEGFEKTNKTFENILVRLSKIDEAQKNIEKLSTEVVSLQDVLSDKRARGTFGEVQLKNILENIFGEGNKRIYELQYTLENGKTVDAVLHVPNPMGDLSIDSKFPLENYQKMMDSSLNEFDRNIAKKLFKSDVKKHINDIHEKYIISNVTSEQAVMFVPAEAVFAEINAYHPDIIEHSQKRKVWIASPTTIMSLLTTVQVIIQNVDRNKNMAIIHDELNKLGDEFKRYRTRWDKLARNIKNVTDTVSEIHTTSNKIDRRFNAIKSVDLDQFGNFETKKIVENK